MRQNLMTARSRAAFDRHHRQVLRAVFFDLDETLIDQRSAADAAIVAWAHEHGITDSGVPQRWATLSDHYYSRYQRREMSFQEQRRERVRRFLGDSGASDDRADRLFESYLARYEAGWTTFADTVPALRRTRRAGLLAAVLTNGDAAQQERKLRRLQLHGEVDLLIATSDLPAGKPDRRVFDHALERARCGPDEAIMVGDSLENDVRGALRCGWSAVLVDRHGTHGGSEVARVTTLDEIDFDEARLRGKSSGLPGSAGEPCSD